MTFKTHRSVLLHPPRAAAAVARIQKKIVQVKIIQTFPLLGGPHPHLPAIHLPTTTRRSFLFSILCTHFQQFSFLI